VAVKQDVDLPAVLKLLGAKQVRSIVESQDTPQIALWAGAVRSGKTIASLIAFLLALQDAPQQGLIVIVGRTLQTIERNVIDPLQADELFGWCAPLVSHTRGSGVATIMGRAVHLVGASDVRSEGRIRGSTISLAYVDEATLLPQAFWMMLLSRLSTPNARMFATTNPDSPSHWLRKHFMLRSADVGMRYWNFRLEDNPSLTAEYVARLKLQYTGLWYRRYIDGAWCTAEGAIYEEWDESAHVVPWFRPPDDWPRWWSIDFGYIHPFIGQFWAQDPDGRLYLYREIVYTHRLVEDHARQILSLVRRPRSDIDWTAIGREPDPTMDRDWEWTEPRPREVICDHDAEDRATLERHLGMSTKAATKNVSEGIQAVAGRLRPAGDGKPRLFVMRGAVVERDPQMEAAKTPIGLEEELPGYVWDTGGGKGPKEQPLKEKDDSDDAARYIVAECDLGAQPRYRSFRR
jgi:hypothetical protein